MLPLQEIIHQIEVGKGAVLIRRIASFLALLGVLVVYDYREYRNLATEEGMDVAQLARNLAAGKGFVTQNVRPFSCWLVQQNNPERSMRLKEDHPDLANPPVYPLLVAAVLKLPAVDYRVSDTREKQFRTFQPELFIALLNQFLLLLAAWMVYRIAKRLFDPQVAWLSMVVFVACDLMWRFSVSGQSTILVIVIFLALVWLLARLEEGARAEQPRGAGWFLGLAAAVGAVMALGTLTRYSFGWLIIPVLVFLGVYVTKQRLAVCAVALLVFAGAITPWLIRNYHLSGALFGIPGYALYEDTGRFAGAKLMNSLEPDLSKTGFQDFRIKFVSNVTALLRDDLPKLGGSWVTAFFLPGLLIPFKRPGLGRLRVFLILSLVVFTVGQSLGRTHLSAGSPEVTHDNLLVILTPLVFIFGVAFYFLLLDQLCLPFIEARILINAGFIIVMCAPFLFTLLPPKTFPIAYPPYFPPYISMVSGWMNEDELMMSDMPWAVAWYGNRKCVGTTTDLQKDFFAINDFQKPVQGLYLTPLTLDGRFMSQILSTESRAWGVMLLESLLRREVPAGFPLKMAPEGFFPKVLSDQCFLTDRERWRNWPPRASSP